MRFFAPPARLESYAVRDSFDFTTFMRTMDAFDLRGELPIITVSRGSFSVGISLAERVAKNLGYKCVSREVLTGAANQYGVQEEALRKALVDKPGILERMTVERVHYLACIRAALLKEARNDDLVYTATPGTSCSRGSRTCSK